MPSRLSLARDRRHVLRGAVRSALVALVCACGEIDDATAPASGGAAVSAVAAVRAAAWPVTGAASDYDALLAMVGDARVVLLGESTHGTREFYRERARITQRLIRERGFTAVAVEGGWGEAYRVNEYVRGLGADVGAEQALAEFTRFPRWMWAYTEVRDLVQWMRTYNEGQPESADVGFYGLDIQSLGPAVTTLARVLAGLDPTLAERVRERLTCLTRYGDDEQAYGSAVASSPAASCQGAVAVAVEEVRQGASARPSDPARAESWFAAVRSAEVVAHAEEYVRAQYTGGTSTWNLRDRRMAEGLQALETHLASVPGRSARVVVWAHNTHTGDARETDSAERGELNLGQLARERLGAASVNVGFLTFTGTVFAAPDWGAEGRVDDLRPALSGSFASMLHDVATGGGPRDFLLVLRGESPAASALADWRLERAVGVVYLPATERQSHYFAARLSRQFDAVIHVDSSSALRPLPAGAATRLAAAPRTRQAAGAGTAQRTAPKSIRVFPKM
jgi:erythromycin esterase-like protein